MRNRLARRLIKNAKKENMSNLIDEVENIIICRERRFGNGILQYNISNDEITIIK